MNKTSNLSLTNVIGSFGRSGFFKKSSSGKSAAVIVRPRYREAATAAQAARLSEVLGRGMASHLRF